MNNQLFERLKEILKPYYEEEHRVFHAWVHIDSGLNFIEELNESNITIPDAGVLAWLFHDIVYNPLSKTNEEDSIVLLRKTVTGLFSDDVINDAASIILDTKKHMIEYSKHLNYSGYILDIDMSSLGLPLELFFYNRRLAMNEYQPFYSQEQIEQGTNYFIDQTLKNNIFKTDYFYLKNEEQARNNLISFKSVLNEPYDKDLLLEELSIIKVHLKNFLNTEIERIKSGSYIPFMNEVLHKDCFIIELKRSFGQPVIFIKSEAPFENNYSLKINFHANDNTLKFYFSDENNQESDYHEDGAYFKEIKKLNTIKSILHNEINTFYLLSQAMKLNPNSYKEVITDLINSFPNFFKKELTHDEKELLSLKYDIKFNYFDPLLHSSVKYNRIGKGIN